ncbi:MAG: lipopolysaccharide transport periplasmic protein LptA [Thermodesulfobacteriota bacterium]
MNSLGTMAYRVPAMAVLLLYFLMPAGASAEPARKKVLEGKDIPTVIKSDSLEIDNKRRVVTFLGNVEAVRGDVVMRCSKMLVHYREAGAQKAIDQKSLKLDRIVAKGDVRVRRAEGGEATAEEAVYYQDTEKIVLRGKPVVKQGEDFVEGGVITLFLNEDRSLVEGADDQKVRAVLGPRSGRK